MNQMSEKLTSLEQLLLDEPKIGNLKDRAKYICKVIIYLIKAQKGFKTFAVYGKWGSGKTSICKTIHEQFQLDKQQNKSDFYYIPVWFDAWRFQQEKEIYPALLRTIGNELIRSDCSEELKIKAKKLTKSAFKILQSVLAGFKASLPFLDLEYSAKDTLDHFYSKKEETTGIFDKINDEYESPYLEAFDILQSIPSEIKYKNKNIHILIFIDDLDRCLPDIAFKLIEQLKIWFDIKGYTICMALKEDEIIKVVSKHLKNHLDIEKSDADRMASDYLLKVISIGVYIDQTDFEDKVKTDKNQNNEFYEKVMSWVNNNNNNSSSSNIEDILKDSPVKKSYRELINLKNEVYIESQLREELKKEEDRKNKNERKVKNKE